MVDGGSVNQRRLLSKGSFVIVDEVLAGKGFYGSSEFQMR